MSETLLILRETVERLVNDPAISDEKIDATINRGVTFIAGGATRSYNVPTIPPLEDLQHDFTVNTVVGSNSVRMPDDYHRGAYTAYDNLRNELKMFDSLISFRRNNIRDNGVSGTLRSFCIFGKTFHYSQTPIEIMSLLVPGFRLPIDMVDDSDTPDGIPDHLQYDLLTNYAAMILYGETEQDAKRADYNTAKHRGLFSAALTDLHSQIKKDIPSVYTPVDRGVFIN